MTVESIVDVLVLVSNAGLLAYVYYLRSIHRQTVAALWGAVRSAEELSDKLTRVVVAARARDVDLSDVAGMTEGRRLL